MYIDNKLIFKKIKFKKLPPSIIPIPVVEGWELPENFQIANIFCFSVGMSQLESTDPRNLLDIRTISEPRIFWYPAYPSICDFFKK